MQQVGDQGHADAVKDSALTRGCIEDMFEGALRLLVVVAPGDLGGNQLEGVVVCDLDARLLTLVRTHSAEDFHWVSHHPASQFCHLVQELMDHPENVGLSGPDKIKTDNKQKRKYKEKRRDKKDISSPCGFQHHVSLSVEEWTKMTAFQ